jgi:hypothetical protein
VKLCEVCKRRTPEGAGATICDACKARQARTQRWLVTAGAIFAPFVPVVSLLFGGFNLSSALGFESQTHFRLLPSQTNAISIKASVWNSGKKPSVLLAARLIFEDPRVAPVPVWLRQPRNEGCTVNVINAKQSGTACFRSDAVVFLHPGGKGPPYPVEEALALVRNHKVTLQIDVQESNDPGIFRSHHTLEETFDESIVDPFLEAQP